MKGKSTTEQRWVLTDWLIYRKMESLINADQDMTLKDFLSLTIDHTPIDTADSDGGYCGEV